jgi:hypothetical protein
MTSSCRSRRFLFFNTELLCCIEPYVFLTSPPTYYTPMKHSLLLCVANETGIEGNTRQIGDFGGLLAVIGLELCSGLLLTPTPQAEGTRVAQAVPRGTRLCGRESYSSGLKSARWHTGRRPCRVESRDFMFGEWGPLSLVLVSYIKLQSYLDFRFGF